MPQTARPAQAPRQRCSGVSVTSHKRNEAGPTQKLTALELVKAMVREEVPAGVQHTKGSGHKVYEDDAVTLTMQEAFFAPVMRGYVLQAENRTGVSVPVPVQNLEMPGLLAVAADQQLLYPRPQTVEEELAAAHRCKVYLVVK